MQNSLRGLFQDMMDDHRAIFFGPDFPPTYKSRTQVREGRSVVELDIPGRKREHVRVYTKGGELHIEVQQVGDRAAIHETYQLHRRHDPNKVKARIQDGVLTVTVSKRQEPEPEVREVPVK